MHPVDQDLHLVGSVHIPDLIGDGHIARHAAKAVVHLVRMSLVQEINGQGHKIDDAVRYIVLRLAGSSKLILYEQPLQLPETPADKEGTLLERVVDMMAQLLATGKIDAKSNLEARFTGDKRVLVDIKLLADSGYGEDNFGNNIPLPDKLFYLRR